LVPAVPDNPEMTRLPNVLALLDVPFDSHTEITGIRGVSRPKIEQQHFDTTGLWWAIPFAYGESGCQYAFRLAPGSGHGAVLRCLDGHAVTIASTPERAIFAVLACERLLAGREFRTMLHDGWANARDVLRAAVTITGGRPDRLDDVLHLADELPNWVSPAPTEQEEKRREMLWRICGEDSPASASHESPWSRANDSRLAPEDPHASLRLLQGNHGLDGTHASGGLLPGSSGACELLAASARRLRDAGIRPDDAWAGVVNAIADRGVPEATDFIAPSVNMGAARGWDGLAAASFWFHAVGRSVPEDHVSLAEEAAELAGAKHIIEARRLLA
jgi:hypothetical protein